MRVWERMSQIFPVEVFGVAANAPMSESSALVALMPQVRAVAVKAPLPGPFARKSSFTASHFVGARASFSVLTIAAVSRCAISGRRDSQHGSQTAVLLGICGWSMPFALPPRKANPLQAAHLLNTKGW